MSGRENKIRKLHRGKMKGKTALCPYILLVVLKDCGEGGEKEDEYDEKEYKERCGKDIDIKLYW